MLTPTENYAIFISGYRSGIPPDNRYIRAGFKAFDDPAAKNRGGLPLELNKAEGTLGKK